MGREKLQVMLVDPAPDVAGRLQEVLQGRFQAVELVVAESLFAARDRLACSTLDVIVAEWQLPDGLASELCSCDQADADIPLLVLTQQHDMRVAVAAIKAGAVDCLLKTADGFAVLPQVVAETLAARELRRDKVATRAAARSAGSEEKFRTFFECAAAGMVTISADGYIQAANEAFCLFIGYSREELAALHVLDITHPDDLKVTDQTYQRLSAGRSRAISYRKRFICKEGAVRWGHVSVAVVADEQDCPQYYVGLVQDVTEYKLAQDQIREAKQMLELILDYIPQYVFWKDRDSVYLGSNRNFAKAAGVDSPQRLVGKTDFDLPWTPEEARFYRACDRRIMDADQPELHIIETQLQANGKQIWVDTNKIPLHDADGKVVGILGTFEDITERKRAEDELVKANRELDAFVYTVSHDLRTPLTPIIGYAEALLEIYRGQLDAQAVEWLTKIEAQSRRMLTVMEDLLKLARVGHIEPPAEAIDTDSVLDELLIEMGGQIVERGAVLSRSELPAVRVPRTLLAQMFDNALSNALRYAGAEGSPIEISGGRKGGRVWFCVRDHGPGIRPDEMEEVFELFYRGAESAHAAGTGVGLATVQKIARLYGGRAWIDETPGGGCTLMVEMRNV